MTSYYINKMINFLAGACHMLFSKYTKPIILFISRSDVMQVC